jgi:hypothetical protein
MEPVADQTDTPTLPLHREAPPVALEQPVSQPEPKAPETQQAVCPRCGAGKLVDPDSLGWCSRCGYCRSLEEESKKVLEAARPAGKASSALGAAEFGNLVQRLPRWSWILGGGTLVIVVLSVAANFALPEESLSRALWSTAQLLFGLLSILAAQVWCLFILAPEDDKLGSKDILFATRLWAQTFRRLPEMCRQVWLGGWGASAALSAVFIVGGFSYWYQFYKPKKFAEKSLISAVKDLADKSKNKAKSLEEAIEDMAKTQDLTKDNKKDTRPLEQCVIIGYMVDDKKNITGLVLAGVDAGQIRYLGQVKRGFTPEASEELLGKLTKIGRPEPLIPNLRLPDAIWVEPELFCEVHHSGRDRDGLLVDSNFAALLESK